ncbi:hypothetical protein PDE_08683 [Penicillium oxalicum 114-2]|uniref:Uncharacterized protein n=1 Tax=Penicillium oxalicum (strain 114-2 / CGMCC 5302) TaxID=933388 RepID=S7ZY28_PENO1|nr:hypothetical protein PDE_08683 [Penicillium oxalicum 114-2]
MDDKCEIPEKNITGSQNSKNDTRSSMAWTKVLGDTLSLSLSPI